MTVLKSPVGLIPSTFPVAPRAWFIPLTSLQVSLSSIIETHSNRLALAPTTVKRQPDHMASEKEKKYVLLTAGEAEGISARMGVASASSVLSQTQQEKKCRGLIEPFRRQW
jgi:hypothetical protein